MRMTYFDGTMDSTMEFEANTPQDKDLLKQIYLKTINMRSKELTEFFKKITEIE